MFGEKQKLLKEYLKFSEKVKDKVKNKLIGVRDLAQNPKRKLRTIDEKVYSFLNTVEGIAWKIRNTVEHDALWRTKSKLERIRKRIEENSDDLDLELLLELEKYGGEK